jgi:hypothetical protein
MVKKEKSWLKKGRCELSERKIDPHKAIDFIFENAPKLAQAKADRIYLEEFRKSKKAMLMIRSCNTVISAQERDAYAHPEYIELLKGLQAAVEQEETIRWSLIAAQARIEVWRSQEATNRSQDHLTR